MGRVDVDSLRETYEALSPTLNERSRRVWAATEARAIGRGGVGVVAETTGTSASTNHRCPRDFGSNEHPLPPGSMRRPGGGRKRTADTDTTLIVDLEGLIEPTVSRGPQSPPRWTSRSVRRLSRELQHLGHDVSHALVASLVSAMKKLCQLIFPVCWRDADFRPNTTTLRMLKKRQAASRSVFPVYHEHWRPQAWTRTRFSESDRC